MRLPDPSRYERPARGSPHLRVKAQLDQLGEGRGAAGDEYSANKSVKERSPGKVCKRSRCTHPKAGSGGDGNERRSNLRPSVRFLDGKRLGKGVDAAKTSLCAGRAVVVDRSVV